MNKLSLLLITIAFFTIGCHDINVLAPKIEDVNQPLKLEYTYSFKNAFTTDAKNEVLRYTVDNDNGVDYLNVLHIITVDANTEMDPYSKVVDDGRNIEIDYRDHVNANTVSAGHTKNYLMTHRYRILQKPGENAKTFNVRVNYQFANEALRSNSPDNNLQYLTLNVNF